MPKDQIHDGDRHNGIGGSGNSTVPAGPKTWNDGRPATMQRTELLGLRLDQKRPETRRGAGSRVADVYTERITLQLSPAMRDHMVALARELQRSRKTKGERITANTMIRAAINAVRLGVKLEAGDTAMTEEEVFQLVWRKLARIP